MRPGSFCASRERGYQKYSAEINSVITISFQWVAQWNTDGFWASQSTHKWFVQLWSLIWDEDSGFMQSPGFTSAGNSQSGGARRLHGFRASQQPVCGGCTGLRACPCLHRGDGQGEQSISVAPWPLPGSPPCPWVPPAPAWGRAEVKPCSFGSLVVGKIPWERLPASQKFYWNAKRVGAALIIVLTSALGGLCWLRWPR